MAILHVSHRQAIGSPCISTKKSVDMDVDMDGKFHIHGKPGFTIANTALCIAIYADALQKSFFSVWRSNLA